MAAADHCAPKVTGQSDDSELRQLSHAKRLMWLAIIPTSVIMALMMVHMFVLSLPGYLLIVAALAFPVVFIAGKETHQSSMRSLTRRKANMNVLITMGSIPPYVIGLMGFVYPMTSFIEMGATIMSFHLIGRYLEAMATGRASQAIRKLVALGAKTAHVIRDGQELEMPVKDLAIEDIMVVRPGDKIPTDGEVIEGYSHVNEAIATGESVPVQKSEGTSVLGATINVEGLLKVRVTRVGSETFLAQVIKLVEQAQSTKVPIQEFADRITSYFVPAVLAVSMASFTIWMLFAAQLYPIAGWGAGFLPWVDPSLPPWQMGLLSAVAVLVIACPCALGMATPTAIMVSSGMGADRGVLIRSGLAIQTLKDIRLVVLDKTGTITMGKPAVTDIVTAGNGFAESDILRMAAAVEAGSEHPIGQAIVARSEELGLDTLPVAEFESVRARGVRGKVDGKTILVGARRLLADVNIPLGKMEQELVSLEAQGKTALFVTVDEQMAGVLAVADTVREDSASAIRALKDLHIDPVMVTGDNEGAASAIAAQVGIEKVYSGVLPEGKVDIVRELQEKHGPVVAMVGDGINDAPALKQANVGIAIGAGADVAIEAADVTLIRSELSKVVEAIRLSRATFGKIKENLFWAWLYNTAAIPIAAVGLLHPMIGVIAMTASSLSVVGNSLLLRRVRLDSGARLPAQATLWKVERSKQYTEKKVGAASNVVVKDPVCGMEIQKDRAAAREEYQGKTYYFCSHDCHVKFKATPQTHAS
jgi:P-type Cu+ transporter